MPWTPCCGRWCSALLPLASRSCKQSYRSGIGKEWGSQGLFLTLEGRECPLLSGWSPPQCHTQSTLQGGCPAPLGEPGAAHHGPLLGAWCPLAAVSVMCPLQPPPVSQQSLAHGTSGPALSPELSLHQSSGRHFTPLCRHRSSGSCCCSSPALWSLVLSSPDLTGAETHRDLPVLHREPSPEALYSWLPRGPYPHPPIADPPRQAPAQKPSLHGEGSQGCVLAGGHREQMLPWGWHLPTCLATRTARVQPGLQQCCFCWHRRQLPGNISSFSPPRCC